MRHIAVVVVCLAGCVAEVDEVDPPDDADPVVEDEALVDCDVPPADVTTIAALATGTKRVLVIRIEFQDLFYTQTAATGQDIMDNQVRPRYQTSSYGRADLASTVTPKVYRLPHPASYYATYPGTDVDRRNVIHNDAEHAASADYTLANFDRLVVTFPNLGRVTDSKVKYSGWAQGSHVWINGNIKFGVVAHELGHTMGLYHANAWHVTDGNVVSAAGKSVGYLDGFDIMGINYQASDPRADFNPRFKSMMGWIDASRVRNVTASGKYRVFRFDDPGATTGTLALTIKKDATRTYWIGLRRAFTDNAIASNGAYIIWGYANTGNWQTDHKTDLIDMVPSTYEVATGYKDAMLPIGSSLVDAAGGVTITPVAKGGTAPHEYLDVQISFH